MLATKNYVKVLQDACDKQTLELGKPDNALGFWDSMWSPMNMIKRYNPISKQWENRFNPYELPPNELDIYQKWYQECRYRSYDLQDLAHTFTTVDSLELVNKKGKLLKRFNKYVKECQRVDIDSATLGVIGDKLQQYISSGKSVTFDFHDSIDWDDGYFGKSGSCWWGEYGDSRPTFENAGGWAIRFYDGMNDRRGIGRTWVLPYGDALVCFNSYGIERGIVIQTMKRIFSERGITLQHAIRDIENDYNSSIPYINGGSGFVLAEAGHHYLTETGTLYLELDVIEDRESRYRCEFCNNRISEDHTYSDPSGYYIICESCYRDRYTYCQNCESEIDRDEMIEIHGHSRYSSVCRDCANKLAVECSECGEYHTKDYVICDDSDNAYCDECAATQDIFHCDECGENYEYDTGCETCKTGTYTEDESEVSNGDDSPNVIMTKDDTVNIMTGILKEYKVTTWKSEQARGLFVYPQGQTNPEYSGYVVIHADSGLTVWSGIDNRKLATEFMLRIGSLTDWTHSQTDIPIREISQSIRDIRQELGIR